VLANAATAVLVGAPVLLHVVLSGKGLVALRANCILPAGVLFRMPSSMTRRRKVVVAIELFGKGAGITVFFRLCGGCPPLRR